MKRGDLVTVIYRRGLVLTRVHQMYSDTYTPVHTLKVGTVEDGFSFVRISDRGVTWIPGWHPRVSRQGAALVTAYELAR